MVVNKLFIENKSIAETNIKICIINFNVCSAIHKMCWILIDTVNELLKVNYKYVPLIIMYWIYEIKRNIYWYL